MGRETPVLPEGAAPLEEYTRVGNEYFRVIAEPEAPPDSPTMLVGKAVFSQTTGERLPDRLEVVDANQLQRNRDELAEQLARADEILGAASAARPRPPQ